MNNYYSLLYIDRGQSMQKDNNNKINNYERLQNLRKALGFSQREMAEEFGVVHGAIGLWESGKRKMPGPVLKLIALYEDELAIQQNRENRQILESVEKSWLSRTIKISSAGARIAGRMMMDNLRAIAKSEDTTNRIRMTTKEAIAKQIVETFGTLKGLPHKIGQLLSYMDMDAPDTIRDTYSKLQHITPPMKPSLIADIIIEEFGKTPNQMFKKWESEPFAAASIGQVHRAYIPEGIQVAVKIQYPGIVDIIHSDLKNAQILDKLSSLLFRNHTKNELCEELTERFLDECNYKLEAKNQTKIKEIHKENPEIIIPKVFEKYSSKRVLTMEYLEGKNFADFRDTESQERINKAALTIWDHAFSSAIKHKIFNGDPHPGNYLFPENGVIFLDYGCTKVFHRDFFKDWIIFLKAVTSGNKAGVKEAIIKMKILTDEKHFNHDDFFDLMRAWYYPCYTNKKFKFTKEFVSNHWKTMRKWRTGKMKMYFPKELLFINQLQWGLYAVLADLKAEAIWSKHFLPLLNQ